MREIKFRAYNKITNEYDFNVDVTTLLSIGGTMNFDNDYSWEQYTGLKDKNGVEIYENDYIIINERTTPPFKGQVVFYENGAFQCAWGDEEDTFGGDTYLVDIINEDIEVIGNIHQWK